MPSYFTSESITFFKELSKNNNTVWFNENKGTYEKHVKIPFVKFIEDSIKELAKLDSSIQIQAKDAITRINRDIRFSKDKSPYNLHVAAIISAHGKKDKEHPGIYIQVGAEKLSIYGGAYMVEKQALQNIRTYISKDLKGFEKVISEKAFKQLFGEIQGEKNKVLAPEFKSLLDKQPLLANKAFYYFVDLPVNEITSSTLLSTIVKHFKAAKPVNDYLLKAMS